MAIISCRFQHGILQVEIYKRLINFITDFAAPDIFYGPMAAKNLNQLKLYLPVLLLRKYLCNRLTVFIRNS